MKDCAVILASFLTACLAVEVQFGGRVSLPCNSSAYGRGELDVQWEAMGKDVAFFQDGQLVSGSGYEGRLELQISQALEGDFSLTLNHAVMSDSDMYECLWQGKRSISTVILKVLPPSFPELHTMVREGEDVTLPCYANIPKNKPLEKMFIQWLKDDKEVLLLSSGEITTKSINGHLELPPTEDLKQGILSLNINAVTVSDQGVYRCLYRAVDFETPKSGDPETYTLRVLESTWMEEAFNVTEMTSLSSSTETTELTTSTNGDATTAQDTGTASTPWMEEAFNVTEMTSLSSSTETTELTTSTNGNATTAQDTATVTSEMLPQSNTTIDFTWFIDDASEGGTTIQDTTEEILPEPSPTADVFGFIVDNSADSTTIQDTEGVISQIHPQPSPTAHLIGFIADNSADSTTVEDTVEETIPHPSRTKDFAGLVADSRDDINGGQDLLEGEGESFELVLDEKVPWVRIGIISGVLLVTAALMGTLLALGKL
ncbi:uncharacterized protein LOC103025432 isoform X1 [Astyanax mexicanus]|uniref:uncharacterized protein LOC103025432 isoform X1 n=1 Tax=Astyanax mexicanus TaxID=7994 RepID=UPI0020CAC6F3|nr:uncharacterized protein LOC103025432 isoform X1 [Astyanax mexicanus]